MTGKHSLLLWTAMRSESRGTPSPQAGSGPDITTVFYTLATESSHTLLSPPTAVFRSRF